MIRLSDWYATLGEYSFPTIFIHLNAEEIKTLLEADENAPDSKALIARLHTGIKNLPGPVVIGADTCMPTDSPRFNRGRWVSFGRTAWRLLRGSDKIRTAFSEGHTQRLAIRPFRNMDKTREFRMFIHQRKLVAMSQYCLERHFKRLAKRDQEIWQKGLAFMEKIAGRLPADNVVADIYLTSAGDMLLVDLNTWGPPTDPLLLRTWERDWQEPVGLKLIPKPIKMKGDISVSF